MEMKCGMNMREIEKQFLERFKYVFVCLKVYLNNVVSRFQSILKAI